MLLLLHPGCRSWALPPPPSSGMHAAALMPLLTHAGVILCLAFSYQQTDTQILAVTELRAPVFDDVAEAPEPTAPPWRPQWCQQDLLLYHKDGGSRSASAATACTAHLMWHHRLSLAWAFRQ
ncbi:dual specificity phosphatase 28-like [Vulpes lagopus]|uniref:dual specificity phosphatase 28-like n=1 Tax=Vulpes lagopus TaxID=494514 RepID=UPI001BC94513|nr:dual specificity phosphatase 28-like [Vulpes lagopus]